jgi:flagellar biosynthetic protein FliR
VVWTIDFRDVAIAGAVTLRFSILAATLPFLGIRNVPPTWRLALAVVVAMAVTPMVAGSLTPGEPVVTWSVLIAEAVRSLLVGALLAFVVMIPLAAMRLAGDLIGLQIGFGIVNTIDPLSSTQVSVLGELYYLLGAVIFFAVDAHHTVLAALVQSCTLLPLFAPLQPSAGAWFLLRDFGQIFRIGLQVGAPCIIVLLLLSAVMGVIVKTVPHINILIVGFPLRIAAGLFVMGLSLMFFGDNLVPLLQGMEGRITMLLGALR